VVGKERERLGPIALAHPGLVAELDGQAIVRQALTGMEDLVLVLVRDHEPVGILQQDGAELPRLAQRV